MNREPAVKIADLKAHLSHHLSRVRAGETVTVLDRRQPIARIVPIEPDQAGLRARAPTAAWGSWGSGPAPALLAWDDVMRLIADDRDHR